MIYFFQDTGPIDISMSMPLLLPAATFSFSRRWPAYGWPLPLTMITLQDAFRRQGAASCRFQHYAAAAAGQRPGRQLPPLLRYAAAMLLTPLGQLAAIAGLGCLPPPPMPAAAASCHCWAGAAASCFSPPAPWLIDCLIDIAAAMPPALPLRFSWPLYASHAAAPAASCWGRRQLSARCRYASC